MHPYTTLSSSLALLLSVLNLLVIPALGAAATQTALEIEISEAYTLKENDLQRDNLERVNDLHFQRDRSYNLINITPSLSLTAEKHLEAFLSADLVWENPVEDDRHNGVDAELNSAFISIKGGKLRTDLGFQPVLIGNGFIMADNVPAAVVHMDFGKGYAEMKSVLALDSSPLFGLTLGYRPGYFEHIEIFAARFQDQDDAFAASAPLVYQLWRDLSSEGSLTYYGASARLFAGNALLSMTGACQTGEFTISNGIRDATTDVDAWFGDIGLERNFSEWLNIGIFCFFASGEQIDRPLEGKLNAWVSVNSYNPRAVIFFDPDFFDNDDADRLTFGGGFGGGLIAPGAQIAIVSPWGLSAQAAWINFYADKALEDGARWYGWEADVEISYTFRDQYRLFVEAARFEHGNYFESRLDETIDPAMRITVGLSAAF
jgi:hypothetical protein